MKIFCVGIGGIGLSGVAHILKERGNEVAGSDSAPSVITDRLQKDGITFFANHSAENIDASYDLLIYSEAVPDENPERRNAQEFEIPQINYAKALAKVSEGKKTIAITGTHGKTTVTGMLTSILLAAQTDPTIIIGSKINLLDDQNFRIGRGELFLCEACEYRDNFLELTPDIVLINNLDPDHLDYFKTAENYYRSFQKLAEKIPSTGTLILFAEDQTKLDLSQVKASIKILQRSGKAYALKIPGMQNQQNAFAAEEVAKVLNISEASIQLGLRGFHGTWRRFEYKGSLNGAKVYDDYGHHPTEIKATIQAAREWYPKQSLVVVFQPHQYSRTHEFFEEFAQCFKGADHVWITDIYKARDSEKDIQSTSAEKLAASISASEHPRYVPLEQIAAQIRSSAKKEMIFLVMGAGNINQIFQHLSFDEVVKHPEAKSAYFGQ